MILGCTAVLGVGICGVRSGGGFAATGLAGGGVAAALGILLGAHLAILAAAAMSGGLFVLGIVVTAGHVLGVFAFAARHRVGSFYILAMAAGHFGLRGLCLAILVCTASTVGFVGGLGGIGGWGRSLLARGRSGGLLSDRGQPSGDKEDQKNGNQSEFHMFTSKTGMVSAVGGTSHAGQHCWH